MKKIDVSINKALLAIILCLLAPLASTPRSPSPQHKKKSNSPKKEWKLLPISLLLTTAIGGGGVYFWKNKATTSQGLSLDEQIKKA